MRDIAGWLEGLGLGVYTATFLENGIDRDVLPDLTELDLEKLDVKLGHRKKLLKAIAALREEDDEAAASWHSAAERRQLTVMFCDLVGSTELSRQLDAEDLRELLQRYQAVVAAAILRYEGYVAQRRGDGVLAYFGWPQAHEDQAERAVRAAIDALGAVVGISLNNGDTLQARVGIATGRVVVGDLHDDVTSDAEAVTGATPNLAARLQGVAQAGQIVISATTRRLLGTTFELKDLGVHKLKGFAESVPAWVVIGESSAESRFEAAHGQRLTQLVGREHELSLLWERWELAKGGEGQVVLLSGEAGIGKSRMVQDFRSAFGDEPRFNLHYQCSPHHSNSAFHPVIQRIQRAAGFLREDSSDTKLDKLEKLLVQMSENVDATAPLLAVLLSLPGDSRYGTLDLTPQQLRHQIIEALIEQVLALGRQRPVVFVFEDVHWIDPSTSDFIGEMMSRIADQAVLMLITYRPEHAPLWPGHSHLTSVALNRLGRKQAAEIARVVGREDLADAVIESIVARADGVPLYVEELTKSVLERSMSADEPVSEELIPATLQSSLVARLDRLDEAKEISQVGATIGREFSYDLVAAVLDKSEVELNVGLDRLVQSGLVFRRGLAPNVTYTFKHSLVQDAAYTTILISRRRYLHARILEVLEAHIGDSDNEKIDLLAHHAYQGQVWDKAFIYLQQAGAKAMDRAAVREAVAQFEFALLAGSQLPETQESLEQAIDLRFDLRNALWSIGGFEEILNHLRGAERLAKKLNDPRRIGWVSVYTSASLWQLGRSMESRESARNALAINKKQEDLALGIGANFYLGCAYVTSGDCRRAEAFFRKIADSLTGDQNRDRCGLPFVPAVVARSWLAWALAERGEFETGMNYAQEALQIAKEVGHPFNLAHIYYDLGYFYAVKGEFSQAVDALEKAFALIREWRLTYLSPFITGFLGHACALAGQVDRGITLLRQATSEYESMGLGLFRSLVGVQLGEALFFGGQVEDAFVATERALALARKRAEQGHEAYALRLLGDIAAHPDALDAKVAQAHYEEAIVLADKFGMRPLAAHCQLGFARLHQNKGDRQKATGHSQKAAAMYAVMGMHAWEERANGVG